MALEMTYINGNRIIPLHPMRKRGAKLAPLFNLNRLEPVLELACPTDRNAELAHIKRDRATCYSVLGRIFDRKIN